LSQQTRGEVPHFRRVVIETSGLADPAPIAYTLLSEPVLRHHFRLSGIVTTIDAVNGASQLGTFAEAVKQASMADRLVVTKADLSEQPSLAALRQRLRALNVSAQILQSIEIGGDVHRLLTDDIYDAEGKFREAIHWTAEEIDDHGPHGHTAGVESFAAIFDRPLDWTAFGVWASMLLHRHGADVLRLKGLLNVAGVPTPVLINGVQHIVHPPSHLERWPDADRRSRLIFIVRGLQRTRIERSLAAFNDLVNTPVTVTV
jgi:G3E family GTPase